MRRQTEVTVPKVVADAAVEEVRKILRSKGHDVSAADAHRVFGVIVGRLLPVLRITRDEFQAVE